jgi:hypothetical protein
MHDVTIIIPIYCTTEKSLEWLGECLESALIQDCEVVTVDDGSPIDVSDITRKFRGNHYPSRHIGVAAARNEAVLRAKSRLVLPLDCDDRLVPGAINKLVAMWDGNTPVYPDVRKFGEINEPHYALLDFTCEHVYTHVGFTSVNVLHAKDQWKSVGGWNKDLEFYEDGEYNARLFARWCAVRLPEPLVEYRIHDSQRTKTYKSESAAYAKLVLSMIRRLDMPCSTCSKRRGNTSQLSTLDTSGTTMRVAGGNSAVDVNSLPGEVDGRVLSQYTGGQGRGKHYYRGISTGFPYKVQYHDYVYADPSDVKTEGDMNNRSLLLRVKQVVKQTMPAPVPTPTPFDIPKKEEPVVQTVAETPAVEPQEVLRKPKKDVSRKAKQ